MDAEYGPMTAFAKASSLHRVTHRGVDPLWFENVFTLDVVDMPWAESTVHEVDNAIKLLGLAGGERILDLACGFGRHALEFSRRGFSVVGVDLAGQLLAHARDQAADGLDVCFLEGDVRSCSFHEEFDVVLSLYDGAIGYFASDEENLAIFDSVARALAPGGKHLLHVPNEAFFRKRGSIRSWDVGTKMLELLEFDWDSEQRRLLASTCPIRLGEVIDTIARIEVSQRVYTLNELVAIFCDRDMHVVGMWSDICSAPISPNDDAIARSAYICLVSERDDPGVR